MQMNPPPREFESWADAILDCMDAYPAASHWRKRVYWNGWMNLVVIEVQAPWETYRLPLTDELFRDDLRHANMAVRRLIEDVSSHKGDEPAFAAQIEREGA